jgi:superfamily II DNA or RNA helicase
VLLGSDLGRPSIESPGVAAPVLALTEKLLADAGGWQAIREARAMIEGKRVVSASWKPPVLQGMVREGDREYRCGLRIRSATDMENLCGCPVARRDGILCAHSLAAGLAVVRGMGGLSAEPASISRATPGGAAKPDRAGEQGGWHVAEAGHPPAARLHIVFPPDPAKALAAGRLSFSVEAECRGKRQLTGALAVADREFGPADAALMRALETAAGGYPAGFLSLETSALGPVLDALRGHPRVTLARKTPVAVVETPIRPRLVFRPQTRGGILVNVELPTGTLVRTGDRLWLLGNGALAPVALPAAHRELAGTGRVYPDPDAFYAEILPELAAWCTLEEGVHIAEPEPPKLSLHLDGALHLVRAKVNFTYTGPVRNRTAEREAREELARLGFGPADASGVQAMHGREKTLPFFAAGLPRLARRWEVQTGPDLLNALGTVERVRPKVEITGSGTDWFRMEIGFVDGSGRTIGADEARRLLASGRTHGRLSDGRTALVDPGAFAEMEEALRDCDPAQERAGVYRIGRRQADFLARTLQDVPGIDTGPGWSAWKGGLDAPGDPVVVGALGERLRPYQVEGVEWMAFLSDRGCGGILADEMGLGKTVQALAFLLARPGRALVVCPSSLVFNWAREAERFLPSLRVLRIEGPERAGQFAGIDGADLVITSYALLRRDAEHYRAHAFETVFLDEAQHIKNPETQNAQAAFRIEARRRFALSGTPLENSVRDLWSLMQFLMPGYLGSRDDFRDRYERPVLAGGDPDVLARLRRRVGPFVKRRLKRDVLKELPPRIDHVAPCELSSLQASAYRALVEEGRRKVDDALRDAGAGQARMAVLTALLRLRQICCDPRLTGIEATAAESAKLELCMEILQEAVDGGHRVLLFSQFTGMLRLIEESIRDAGLRHLYLDGSTRNRQAVVDQFQSDPSIPVFLISLKAGGTGLNLTAADTVIHYDPWWNPAVEDQAADRAHRIGQDRVVTTYRLVARGTVEERMVELQAKKRDMVRGILDDDPQSLGTATLDELRELLQ